MTLALTVFVYSLYGACFAGAFYSLYQTIKSDHGKELKFEAGIETVTYITPKVEAKVEAEDMLKAWVLHEMAHNRF